MAGKSLKAMSYDPCSKTEQMSCLWKGFAHVVMKCQSLTQSLTAIGIMWQESLPRVESYVRIIYTEHISIVLILDMNLYKEVQRRCQLDLGAPFQDN